MRPMVLSLTSPVWGIASATMGMPVQNSWVL